MTAALELAIATVTGGVGHYSLQLCHAWLKGRGVTRRVERDADLKVEEHRDDLTFKLLDAASTQIAELRTEVVELRHLQSRVAHIEEALDHIHALLHAEGTEERKAAERRARAFLRKMRPTVGDLRNQQTTEIIAQRLAGGSDDGDDTAGELVRKLPPKGPKP